MENAFLIRRRCYFWRFRVIRVCFQAELGVSNPDEISGINKNTVINELCDVEIGRG